MPVKLPDTKPYRVSTLAVAYQEPVEGVDGHGVPAVVHVTKVGRFGEEIELTAAEADRLKLVGEQHVPAIALIKTKGSPLGYEEQNVDQLQARVNELGLSVTGSGANGGVLKDDLVNALKNYDQGSAL